MPLSKDRSLFLPTPGAALASGIAFRAIYNIAQRVLIEGFSVSFDILSGAPPAGFLTYAKTVLIASVGQGGNASEAAADGFNPTQGAIGAFISYLTYLSRLQGQVFALGMVNGGQLQKPAFIPCRQVLEANSQFAIEVPFAVDNTNSPTTIDVMVTPIGRYITTGEDFAQTQGFRAV